MNKEIFYLCIYLAGLIPSVIYIYKSHAKGGRWYGQEVGAGYLFAFWPIVNIIFALMGFISYPPKNDKHE